ncbi:PREDICTED: Retrotransposable element Tf2 [Prunus dulcis]|uniref:PREDICTED: Retrotransposable element Tf2 n=1 Tax=Prunus dulcis TaxID=3755 RepID=A0A5E4FMH4_PRUDU|nr:hypothetical protein L3X38_025936 [Prunus dulcis]VVA28849.1 PREDICTED: Retrotransposable element Tf2 [Prunus dulcis]
MPENLFERFCSFQPKQWLKRLPSAEWSYYTSYHSFAKTAPCEIVMDNHLVPFLCMNLSGTTLLDVLHRSLHARNLLRFVPYQHMSLSNHSFHKLAPFESVTSAANTTVWTKLQVLRRTNELHVMQYEDTSLFTDMVRDPAAHSYTSTKHAFFTISLKDC